MVQMPFKSISFLGNMVGKIDDTHKYAKLNSDTDFPRNKI